MSDTYLTPENMTPNYINPAYASPDQIKTLRAYSDALMFGKGQQEVRRPLQGISNIANALLGAYQMRQANSQEQQSNQAFSQQYLNAVHSGDPAQLAALSGNPRMTPSHIMMANELMKPQGQESLGPGATLSHPGPSILQRQMQSPVTGTTTPYGDNTATTPEGNNVPLPPPIPLPKMGSNVDPSIDPTLKRRISVAYAGAPPEVQAQTGIVSGHRSTPEQALLYQRYLGGGPLAAPPGMSQHEKPMSGAVDLNDPTGYMHAVAPQNGYSFPVRGDYPHAQATPNFVPQKPPVQVASNDPAAGIPPAPLQNAQGQGYLAPPQQMAQAGVDPFVKQSQPTLDALNNLDQKYKNTQASNAAALEENKLAVTKGIVAKPKMENLKQMYDLSQGMDDSGFAPRLQAAFKNATGVMPPPGAQNYEIFDSLFKRLAPDAITAGRIPPALLEQYNQRGPEIWQDKTVRNAILQSIAMPIELDARAGKVAVQGGDPIQVQKRLYGLKPDLSPLGRPQPDQRHIQLLKQNPDKRSDFDQMFGPNSSDEVLGQ